MKFSVLALTLILGFHLVAHAQSDDRLHLTASEGDLINPFLSLRKDAAHLPAWCATLAENQTRVTAFNKHMVERQAELDHELQLERTKRWESLGLEPASFDSLKEKLFAEGVVLNRQQSPEPSSTLIREIEKATAHTDMKKLEEVVQNTVIELRLLIELNKKAGLTGTVAEYEKAYFEEVVIKHCKTLDELKERKLGFPSLHNPEKFSYCKFFGHGDTALAAKEQEASMLRSKVHAQMALTLELRQKKALLGNDQHEGIVLLEYIKENLDSVRKRTKLCVAPPPVKKVAAAKPKPKPQPKPEVETETAKPIVSLAAPPETITR